MTDDMDANNTEQRLVDHSEVRAASHRALKRQVATWAKRWALGMALAVAVSLILERARLLPLLTSIFALASLIALLVRHKITNRQKLPK